MSRLRGSCHWEGARVCIPHRGDLNGVCVYVSKGRVYSACVVLHFCEFM